MDHHEGCCLFLVQILLLVSYGVERTTRPGHSEILLLSIRAMVCREMFCIAFDFPSPLLFTCMKHNLTTSLTSRFYKQRMAIRSTSSTFQLDEHYNDVKHPQPFACLYTTYKIINAHLDRNFHCSQQSGNFMKSPKGGEIFRRIIACVY